MAETCDAESGAVGAGFNINAATAALDNASALSNHQNNGQAVLGRVIMANAHLTGEHTLATGLVNDQHHSSGLICYNARGYQHPYYYQIQDGTLIALAADNALIIEDSPPSYEMALLCPSVTHNQCPNTLLNPTATMQVILPKEQCKEKASNPTSNHHSININQNNTNNTISAANVAANDPLNNTGDTEQSEPTAMEVTSLNHHHHLLHHNHNHHNVNLNHNHNNIHHHSHNHNHLHHNHDTLSTTATSTISMATTTDNVDEKKKTIKEDNDDDDNDEEDDDDEDCDEDEDEDDDDDDENEDDEDDEAEESHQTTSQEEILVN